MYFAIALPDVAIALYLAWLVLTLLLKAVIPGLVARLPRYKIVRVN